MPTRRAEFLILSLDIGSSSTRAALFDNRARRWPETDGSAQYSISYTPDGGAELAPMTLRRAACHAISQSLTAHEQTPSRRRLPIRAVAASAFWHGLLGLDRQWRPVTPIYTWADSRAAQDARSLRGKISERRVHARTGCMLHASFWPAKLVWLRRTQRQLFRRAARWVSPVDWIYHELFGGAVSSASMASATGLYHQARRSWDEELCAACHVGEETLPQLKEVAEPARLPGSMKNPVRVFTAIGDGAAGNLGSGADRPGLIAINVGTSAAARTIQTKRETKSTELPLGLFRYIMDKDRSVVGGAVSNAGNLRQWAWRELHLKDAPSVRGRVFARAVAAHDPLTVLPFWTAERAPTWPDRPGGLIHGISQSTTAADLLRALYCSVFYRLADILDLIKRAGAKPGRIIVSGGIVRSLGEVRLLADTMGRDVEMASEREASLRGAAVYALQQLGEKVPSPRKGTMIKHDHRLAAGHLVRRERQRVLEKTLTKIDL